MNTLSRKDFLSLPMDERRRILREQAEDEARAQKEGGKMREKIACDCESEKDYHAFLRRQGWLNKDDPSGYIAGEHELTVQEVLQRFNKFIEIAESHKFLVDAAHWWNNLVYLFNGERIRRKE